MNELRDSDELWKTISILFFQCQGSYFCYEEDSKKALRIISNSRGQPGIVQCIWFLSPWCLPYGFSGQNQNVVHFSKMQWCFPCIIVFTSVIW